MAADAMMAFEEFADLGKWEISTDHGVPFAYDRGFGPYCATLYVFGEERRWDWEFSLEEDVDDPAMDVRVEGKDVGLSVEEALREVYDAVLGNETLRRTLLTDVPYSTDVPLSYDELRSQRFARHGATVSIPTDIVDACERGEADLGSYLALSVCGSTEFLVDECVEVGRSDDGKQTLFLVFGEYLGDRDDIRH